jgi:hypothetical protein
LRRLHFRPRSLGQPRKWKGKWKWKRRERSAASPAAATSRPIPQIHRPLLETTASFDSRPCITHDFRCRARCTSGHADWRKSNNSYSTSDLSLPVSPQFFGACQRMLHPHQCPRRFSLIRSSVDSTHPSTRMTLHIVNRSSHFTAALA